MREKGLWIFEYLFLAQCGETYHGIVCPKKFKKIKKFEEPSIEGLQKKLNEFMDENPEIRLTSISIANEGQAYCGNIYVAYIVYK